MAADSAAAAAPVPPSADRGLKVGRDRPGAGAGDVSAGIVRKTNEHSVPP